MPFRARNAYHLRTSVNDVLPLYLYLDERHLEWMSERTLQSVIFDLKSLIGPKLESEKNAHYGTGGPANTKRPTVDVHRGEHYQFAYFLRKVDPHATVLKSRNYVETRPQKPTYSKKNDSFGKRKLSETALETGSGGPLYLSKRQRKEQVVTDDLSGNEDDGFILLAENSEEDAEFIQPRDQAADKPSIDFGDDDDEASKKPTLQLKFRSLSMHDRCLCVVVEPWSPFSDGRGAKEGYSGPSVKSGSKTSTYRADSVEGRCSPTPLFLTDEDEVDFHVPDRPDESEDRGLLSFSQALSNVLSDRVRGPIDDDEMDGSILYGDADEMRFIVQ